MEPAPIPSNEKERLAAVQALGVLDTAPNPKLDQLTQTAAKSFGAPICTISIIDSDREWCKSNVGMPSTEGKRENSFCGHTITAGKIFIVEDATKDKRFADNPQVTGKPHVRFYAGVTLEDSTTRLPVGAFCIKDTKPRTLSADEVNQLLDFAKQAEVELNNSAEKKDL